MKIRLRRDAEILRGDIAIDVVMIEQEIDIASKIAKGSGFRNGSGIQPADPGLSKVILPRIPIFRTAAVKRVANHGDDLDRLRQAIVHGREIDMSTAQEVTRPSATFNMTESAREV